MKLIARHADGSVSHWSVDHSDAEDARAWVTQDISEAAKDESQLATCVLALLTNTNKRQALLETA